ncbi:MAG: hypothetical protein J3T61_00125 [Candidatus Brocadiales bacterium]|nr:hypothetical protein [Candidatus Bathyanammoxibius sp.]
MAIHFQKGIFGNKPLLFYTKKGLLVKNRFYFTQIDRRFLFPSPLLWYISGVAAAWKADTQQGGESSRCSTVRIGIGHPVAAL